MRLTSKANILAVCAVLGFSLAPAQVEAGPLIDWLFGRNRAPAYPVGQPVAVAPGGYVSGYGSQPAYAVPLAGQQGYAANYGYYRGPNAAVVGPGGYGYQALRPNAATAAVLPPTMSYVPNFRTQSYRAPVTYYRPILTTDPNTGAQVVAMAPCTSYEYQTQRVPALGRRALFPSTLLPSAGTAIPQTNQTYTLPSGGIPLAYSSPTYSPTIAGYRGYSAYQPGIADGLVAPSPNYPTAPIGTSPYYGNGGCTGSYAPQAQGAYQSGAYPSGSYPSTAVPGTIAPQAPGGSYRTPAETWGQEVAPPEDGGVFPSDDPRASVQPSLSNNLRPKTRSGYRDQSFASAESRSPRSGLRSVTRQPSRAKPLNASQNKMQFDSPPLMAPIPVPDDFDRESNWTPGLLSDEDKTARKASSIPHLTRYAGQSTKIQWATFEQAAPKAKSSISRQNLGTELTLTPGHTFTPDRTVTPERRSFRVPVQNQTEYPSRTSVAPSRRAVPQASGRSKYNDSGWKAVRRN